MTPQDMISRYVEAVVRRLPDTLQADIRVELTALLHDELEGRAGDQAPDTAMVAELLQGFGHPGAVALRYHQPSPLIDDRDARLFGKIALSLTGALIVLATGVVLSDPAATGDLGFAQRIVDETLAAGLQCLGALLLVFWGVGLARRHARQGRWSPEHLPAVRDPDAVDRPVMILSILFWVAGLAVLMIGPAQVFDQVSGGRAPDALLDAFAYDPGFAVERAPVLWSLLGVSLALVLWQVIAGRLTRLMRRVEAILTLILSLALFQIVLAGDVFAAEPANEYMKLAMALFAGWGLISSIRALHRAWQQGRASGRGAPAAE